MWNDLIINNKKAEEAYSLESSGVRSKITFAQWFGKYWRGVERDEVITAVENCRDGSVAYVNVELKETLKNGKVCFYIGTVKLVKENGLWFTNDFMFTPKEEYLRNQAERERKKNERREQVYRELVDPELSYYEVAKDPFKYGGKYVRWSGVVGSIRERDKKVRMFVIYEDSTEGIKRDNFFVEGELDNSYGLIKGSRVDVIGEVSGVEVGVNQSGVEVEVPRLKLRSIKWESWVKK